MARKNPRPAVQKPQRRRRPPPGSPPGTMQADPQAQAPRIGAICYGTEKIAELPLDDLDAVAGLRAAWPVVWINVDGLGDHEAIRRLGALFGLHPLALEDVVHLHQRPRFEDYGDHGFLVTQMTQADSRPRYEQVSIFFGQGFVLSFQERPGDCFEPVRERLRHARGRIRQAGADYLAYALIDATIDADFPLLERYGEEVAALEDEVLAGPGQGVVRRIHGLKMNLLSLRRVIWPQRDMVNSLLRDGEDRFDPQTRVYLRDCYDHTVELLEMLETYREIASDLIDIHLSSASVRTNEIMRVLTIIATVFIPLSFIASLYGMNFDPEASPWNMPELGWRLGYPFALAIMALIAGGLVAYFWRQGWFRRQ